MDGQQDTTIFFVDNVEQDEYRLFELDESLMEVSFFNGVACCTHADLHQATATQTCLKAKDACRFELRGNEGSSAILTTADRSYSVRLVESSNTQLLLNEASSHDTSNFKRRKQHDGDAVTEEAAKAGENVRLVQGFVSCHYELSEIKPVLTELQKRLSSNLYRGPEDKEMTGSVSSQSSSSSSQPTSGSIAVEALEARWNKGLYTTDDLRQIFQASDLQLTLALEELTAASLDGYWRILSPEYESDALESILDLVMEKDLDVTKIPVAVVTSILRSSYPEAVIRHILSCYSLKQQPPQKEQVASDKVCLDADKVCLFRARQILASQPVIHTVFMEKWEEIVPYGMKPQAAMLRGHALQSGCRNSEGKETTQWELFEERSLPTDAAQRFDVLFSKRQRWTLDDITPYTITICQPGTKLDKLLLRYCRVFNDKDGQQVYSSRR